MKIILLKDVVNVGKKYETKDLSDGYAINFLIPKGLAISATPSAQKRIDLEIKKLEGEKKIHQDLLVKNLAGLENVTITVAGKANEKGHLFAGMHKKEVAAAIKNQTRLEIDSESIQLDHPIKEIGEHTIPVTGAGKTIKFKLSVTKA